MRVVIPRAAATVLSSVLIAGGTPASSQGVRERSAELVTYEVPAPVLVASEVPPQITVVKEIAPDEAVRKKRSERQQALAQRPKAVDVEIKAVGPEIPDLAAFLDRLMVAESGGRDNAKNPLSTAIGPFQFIKSTFLDVARRHFPDFYGDLTDEQILSLRTVRYFARSAAAAYTLENAALLKADGHEPTWTHLRLAFLLGPSGASRVLQAEPEAPLSQVLSASVIQANPFMNGMTAIGLVAKAARDIGAEAPATARGPAAVARPEARARPSARVRPGSPAESKPQAGTVAGVKIRCNQLLASCQRWISLQQLKQKRTRNAQDDGGKRKKG